MEKNYLEKYLKYKTKYVELKELLGGFIYDANKQSLEINLLDELK